MKLFVAAMGASSYIFAQARPSEQIADWIGAHVDLLAFLGGAPKFVVCDNLKAAVTNPDRYEPGLNRSYLEFADHYGVAILPARPYKPRDKAKVEQSVLIAERWILARLRNRRFFSAADLNVAIAEHVGDINVRVMKGYDASRVELFTAIDKPALKALPDEPYAFAVWKRCRVAPDYHVEVDGHWYSAPFRLIRELVDVRVADKTVEIFHKGQRVASQPRAPNRRGHTTIAEHMPSAHRRHAAWTPARDHRLRREDRALDRRPVRGDHDRPPSSGAGLSHLPGHPRSDANLWRRALDAACRRGVSIKARSVASIRSILKNGLDRAFLDEDGAFGPRARPSRATSAAAATSTDQKGYAMLAHPTHERLIALGLPGMAKAFEDQRRSPDIAALSFEERIGLMVDREAAERDTKRLATRLKFAALRQNAVVEDVDLRTPRGIDRALFQKLVAGDWIDRAEGLLITGPTGVGKSWIACALGHKACRDGRSVLYHRVPRLFEALALARGDGRYGRMLKALARVELLILDDWGLSVLTEPEQRDVLEILEDRHQRGPRSSPARFRSSNGARSSATPPSPTPSSTASSTTPTGSR